jgi:hypothetical protein
MQPNFYNFGHNLDSGLVQLRIEILNIWLQIWHMGDMFRLQPNFFIFGYPLDMGVVCLGYNCTFPFLVTSWTRKLKKFGHNLDKGPI